jgi:hypothetical protein
MRSEESRNFFTNVHETSILRWFFGMGDMFIISETSQ